MRYQHFSNIFSYFCKVTNERQDERLTASVFVDLLLLLALSKYSIKTSNDQGKLNEQSTPLYGILG